MKKLLQTVSLAFLLLLPMLGRAQDYRISGRVVDAKTKEPVPFASISLRDSGIVALTDEQGYFQVSSLTSIKQDSIIVMTIGYERYAALIKSSNSNNIPIKLTRRYVDELGIGGKLICRPLTDKDVPPIVKSERIVLTPGTQYAYFIPNEKHKQLGRLRTVSFYIGENGFPMESFRIRIYKADGINHAPNTDLLNERVFLTATIGGEWYTSDLSRYNITAPQEGYFVALEFGKPANVFAQSAPENYAFSGQIMRPAFEFRKSITWNFSPEKGWNLFPVTNGTRRYNAMVKAEVETIK